MLKHFSAKASSTKSKLDSALIRDMDTKSEFQQAIRRGEPDYALNYLGVGDCYLLLETLPAMVGAWRI